MSSKAKEIWTASKSGNKESLARSWAGATSADLKEEFKGEVSPLVLRREFCPIWLLWF